MKFNIKGNVFIALLILTLPFTNSLVINIGFPLKIYEMIACILLLKYVVNMFVNNYPLLRAERSEIVLYKLLIVFFLVYSFSGLINVLLIDKTVIPVWAIKRDSMKFSLIAKLCYLLINIFILYIVSSYIRFKEDLYYYIKLWIIASSVASIYEI
jgi:hypothetical protein